MSDRDRGSRAAHRLRASVAAGPGGHPRCRRRASASPGPSPGSGCSGARAGLGVHPGGPLRPGPDLRGGGHRHGGQARAGRSPPAAGARGLPPVRRGAGAAAGWAIRRRPQLRLPEVPREPDARHHVRRAVPAQSPPLRSFSSRLHPSLMWAGYVPGMPQDVDVPLSLDRPSRDGRSARGRAGRARERARLVARPRPRRERGHPRVGRRVSPRRPSARPGGRGRAARRARALLSRPRLRRSRTGRGRAEPRRGRGPAGPARRAVRGGPGHLVPRRGPDAGGDRAFAPGRRHEAHLTRYPTAARRCAPAGGRHRWDGARIPDRDAPGRGRHPGALAREQLRAARSRAAP